MVVEQAFVGALGCDCDTKMGLPSAQRLKALGMKFLIRYLSIGNPSAGDLDKLETQDILAAGLALMAVQHVRMPGWNATAELGAEDGSHAAHNAIGANLPAGVTVWCDLEGTYSTDKEVIAYVNAWYDAVKGAGYDPGVYVGALSVLNEAQLYADLHVQRYWRSQSQVPNVAKRGYCLYQLYPTTTLGGVAVDIDVVQKDYLGGLPHWLAASPLGASYASTLPPGSADDTLPPSGAPPGASSGAPPSGAT